MVEAEVGTAIANNGLVLMKMRLNQIRDWVAVASTRFTRALAFAAIYLICLQAFATEPRVITLPMGTTGAQIQQALDMLPASGGEVILPPGVIEIHQPIVLRRDHQTLRGFGKETILRLADGANCPVIIMGEPVDNPQQTIRYLCLGNLFIDGNRAHQQRELWQLTGDGSQIHNNGITVQNVSDSVVQHVTSARCRSGGRAEGAAPGPNRSSAETRAGSRASTVGRYCR